MKHGLLLQISLGDIRISLLATV